jgi:hypothetical protein
MARIPRMRRIKVRITKKTNNELCFFSPENKNEKKNDNPIKDHQPTWVI